MLGARASTSLVVFALIVEFADQIGAKVINEVVSINTKFYDNTARHHTAKYQRLDGRSIVLRRGEIFDIGLQLRQPFNRTEDKIRIELAFGPNPQLDKDTLVYIPLGKDIKTSKWTARLARVQDNYLDIQIGLPSNAAIGIWRLRVSVKIAGTKQLTTYLSGEPIYIIFNPWCKEDDVYLPREDARQEYTLNEVGKIYIGSQARSVGRQWNYGQFDSAVLPGMMYLLDKTNLDIKSRANVVLVSRAVSALVNSHDDNGLLVGNWSGNYGDGLAPWQWTGSAVIFRKYMQSGGRPVKFGQCWVFGGVATTSLRTLGIPARTVSNFVSAHDTDSSLTVDKFFSERGDQITGINGDSIWNFHVWSDAWMARRDLPPGYGGWQAIDSTPQEKSMDRYQLGPASLEAIKNGKVSYGYDVGFVYSEVNADLVHWRLDSRSRYSWRRVQITSSHVGRKMLTKMIGVFNDHDYENIIDQYKHPDGSREEKLARDEAIRLTGLGPIFA